MKCNPTMSNTIIKFLVHVAQNMHLSVPTGKIFVTFVLLAIKSDFVQRFMSTLISDIQKKFFLFHILNIIFNPTSMQWTLMWVIYRINISNFTVHAMNKAIGSISTTSKVFNQHIDSLFAMQGIFDGIWYVDSLLLLYRRWYHSLKPALHNRPCASYGNGPRTQSFLCKDPSLSLRG